MLKRFASLPLSLPNFHAVSETGNLSGIETVLNQCFEKNMLILSKDVFASLKIELADKNRELCDLSVTEHSDYVVIESGPLKVEGSILISTDRGWVLEESSRFDRVDHVEVLPLNDRLDLRMEHDLETMRGTPRWITGFPVVERKFSSPVPIDDRTYFRWTQLDRAKALLVTLVIMKQDGRTMPLTYAFNAIPEWRDQPGFNFVDIGNDQSFHDHTAEYTFQRHLWTDMKEFVPKKFAGPLAVSSIRISHLSFTKTDHYRSDRDHGGYVKDMEFLRAVKNDR
jgi:hypothetical protein